MSVVAATSEQRMSGLAALAALCAALFVAPEATEPVVLGVALLAAAVVALMFFPLRHPALAIAGLVLAVDNPLENPAGGKWDSPLRPIGELLYQNLNTSLGLEALHISLLDMLIVALLALALVRGDRGAPGAQPLAGLLVLALGGLALGEGWGAARGGDMRQSLYQLQQLAFAPMLALLLLRALRGPRDLAAVGSVVVLAAVLKAAEGVYFFKFVCDPHEARPQYATTHSDSVLFEVALAIVVAHAVLRRSRVALLGALLLSLAIGAGIYVNNRRLAWVALGAMAPILYAMAPPSRTKRRVARAILAMVPALLFYGAVGWSSEAAVFKPVAMVRSVVSADADRSTGTRDIEDYNLIYTLKQSPLLGQGFGHEYMEMVRADDISVWFPQYRYVPHNSTLGLLAFGGLAAFTLVWLPMLGGALLAVRSVWRARDAMQRTAAVAALTAYMAYAVQGFGDMGLQSWPATVLLALALAVSSQLAVACGAFPAGARLVGSIARVRR